MRVGPRALSFRLIQEIACASFSWTEVMHAFMLEHSLVSVNNGQYLNSFTRYLLHCTMTMNDVLFSLNAFVMNYHIIRSESSCFSLSLV
jgi:hypothetical protein